MLFYKNYKAIYGLIQRFDVEPLFAWQLGSWLHKEPSFRHQKPISQWPLNEAMQIEDVLRTAEDTSPNGFCVVFCEQTFHSTTPIKKERVEIRELAAFAGGFDATLAAREIWRSFLSVPAQEETTEKIIFRFYDKIPDEFSFLFGEAYETRDQITHDLMSTLIADLDISTEARNRIKFANTYKGKNLVYAGDLVLLGNKELLKIRGMGPQTAKNIMNALERLGLNFEATAKSWKRPT